MNFNDNVSVLRPSSGQETLLFKLIGNEVWEYLQLYISFRKQNNYNNVKNLWAYKKAQKSYFKLKNPNPMSNSIALDLSEHQVSELLQDSCAVVLLEKLMMLKNTLSLNIRESRTKKLETQKPWM